MPSFNYSLQFNNTRNILFYVNVWLKGKTIPLESNKNAITVHDI